MCTLARVARRARASLAAQTANNDTRGEFAPKPTPVYPYQNTLAELGQDFYDRQVSFLDEISLMHACAVDSEHVQFLKLPLPNFDLARRTKITPNLKCDRLAPTQFRRTAAQKLRIVNAQLFD